MVDLIHAEGFSTKRVALNLMPFGPVPWYVGKEQKELKNRFRLL